MTRRKSRKRGFSGNKPEGGIQKSRAMKVHGAGWKKCFPLAQEAGQTSPWTGLPLYSPVRVFRKATSRLTSFLSNLS